MKRPRRSDGSPEPDPRRGNVDSNLEHGKSPLTAFDAIGSWSDLDWDEMEQALDRIRHESKPTPRIMDL